MYVRIPGNTFTSTTKSSGTHAGLSDVEIVQGPFRKRHWDGTWTAFRVVI